MTFSTFDQAAGWLQETLLIPLLYELGLMSWEDISFGWALFAVYGAMQVALTFAVCLPLEMWRPVERWADIGAESSTAKASRIGASDQIRVLVPVIEALATELAAVGTPLADREAFRALATRVRERTGQKGKALFHPIRLALTGEAEGLELDLAIPAIEQGAAVLPRIRPVRDRAAEFASSL
jgi:hypothetical protein